MKKIADKNQKKTPILHPNSIKTIVVAAVVIFSALFWELIVGNIPYYGKWQECGRQPVIVNQSFGVGFGAQPPRYFAHTHPGFFDIKLPLVTNIGDATAFCTLDQAYQKYGTDLQIQN